MILEKEKLLEINGGASSGARYGILIGIGGLITFFIGVLSGWVNPSKCN